MHPDMFLLAERLVVAMEKMSQDVNNMSAYLYDLSYSMSHFVNQKGRKEDISLEPCDETDNLSFDTPAAGNEATAEGEYSLKCEPEDASSEPHIDDLENEETCAEENASMNINHKEAGDIFPSSGNPSFTGEIKTEVQSEGEESDDLSDVPNTSVDVRNEVRNSLPTSEEVKSLTQAESEGENLSRGMDSSVSSPHEQLNPLDFLETIVFASVPEPQEILCMETSRDSYPNNYYGTHMTRHQGGESSAARTCKLESDKILTTRGHLMNPMAVCSVERPPYEMPLGTSSHLDGHLQFRREDRPFLCRVCGKEFMQRCHLARHMRVHTGEKPYKCAVCGNAFTQSGSLKVHMNVHAGRCPFACEYCGSSFNTRNSLRCHRILVHGVSSAIS